jgi:hypothetical protein
VHASLVFAEVVADVQGQGTDGYPTCREGWMAMEVMDIARDGQSWTTLPPLGHPDSET